MKKIGFDDLFHLAVIIDYDLNGEKKTATMEKLVVLSFSNAVDVFPREEFQAVAIPTPIKIMDALNNTQSLMGDKFFTYSAFTNNCQNWIYSFLKANNLLTPELSAFILQDAQKALQQQPGYTEDFSQTLTNLGGIASRLIEGYGKANHRRLKPVMVGGNKMVELIIE